jgi:YD repeat-containing protein
VSGTVLRISETDADNNTTSFQFDADNRLTLTTTPQGEQTQTQYDADSDVTETIDAKNNVSQTFYDVMQQPVATQDALGRVDVTVLGPTGEDLADINAIGAVVHKADIPQTAIVAKRESFRPLGASNLVCLLLFMARKRRRTRATSAPWPSSGRCSTAWMSRALLTGTCPKTPRPSIP